MSWGIFPKNWEIFPIFENSNVKATGKMSQNSAQISQTNDYKCISRVFLINFKIRQKTAKNLFTRFRAAIIGLEGFCK